MVQAEENRLYCQERFERDEEHWPDRTLDSYLEEFAEKRPADTAIVGPRQAFTFEEIAALSDRLAASMAADGIGDGDIVSIQLPSWCEFVLVRIAVLKLGAVMHPMPDIYRESDVEYMFDLLDPSAVVCLEQYEGFDYAAMYRDRLAFDGEIYPVAASGDRASEREGTTPFADLLTDAPTVDMAGTDPYDLTLVPFTGGTTGRPKGVMHMENTIVPMPLSYAERVDFTAESTVMVTSPMGHGAGYLWGLYLPLLTGGTAVLVDDWSGERGVRYIDEYDVTHIYAIPTFLHDILNAENLADHDVSSLENVTCGGSTVPRAMIRDARESLGCSVCAAWGQNEAQLATQSHPDDPDEKIATTDGYSYDGMEIRLAGVDEIPEEEWNKGEIGGDSGPLLVRGATQMIGFYGDRHSLQDSLVDDWYITGDLAEIDEDGYVSITGRMKDVIIRGGRNIPVTEIEELLYDHPSVDQVAIVAMPDERHGERACAYVEPVQGETFTFTDMTTYLDENGVAQDYYPEQLQLIDELPKSGIGKIQKFKLREEIADKFGLEPV